MKRSDIDEALAALYLRLNGYFTTGLILHSPQWGHAQTDIDCLAIRHAFHSQAERGLGMAEFLDDAAGMTDLIFCEVKHDPGKLRFNKPIQTEPEALRAMIRWAGIFNDAQVESAARRLQPLLQDGVSSRAARMGVIEGQFRLRAMLCCPVLPEPSGDQWCLTWGEIFNYADQCFNPVETRSSCSTRYNFQQWGHPFTPIVRWFKESPNPLSIEALYDHLSAT